MTNPNKTSTNAGDSAPGVNDGPDRAGGQDVPYHPKGRKAAWILLAIIVVVAALVFLAKPEGTSRENATAAVAPDVRTQTTGPASNPTAQAGGPAGQTPSYNQPGGVGQTEVYSAPGKTIGGSDDAPGVEGPNTASEVR